MRFDSKRDAWLTVLLLAIAALQAASGAVLLVATPVRWPGFVLLASAGLIVWIFRSTYYVVQGKTLAVRSGPLRFTVPIEAIERVTPTRSLLSSPALSLDRLRIDYGVAGRRRSIMVSPRDKSGFLAAIGFELGDPPATSP